MTPLLCTQRISDHFFISALASFELSPLAAGTLGFRPDIQGIRALAVGLVVVHHIAPSRLTGGYIGVDVFFVVSGYLITALLLREVERDGADLASRASTPGAPDGSCRRRRWSRWRP